MRDIMGISMSPNGADPRTGGFGSLANGNGSQFGIKHGAADGQAVTTLIAGEVFDVEHGFWIGGRDNGLGRTKRPVIDGKRQCRMFSHPQSEKPFRFA
ncbi:hypothetical protein L1887_15022 [Cichorium endivia]|nr:hypothetical protein L1887_15022 [Cichorium endivia]